MLSHLAEGPEAIGPICVYLADRWRHKQRIDDRGRRELEMATALLLQWLATGDEAAQEKVRKVAAALK